MGLFNPGTLDFDGLWFLKYIFKENFTRKSEIRTECGISKSKMVEKF